MKTIHFDGACPFLTCLKVEPHEHPICPACGAVRYGNLFCETCQEHQPEIQMEIESAFSRLDELTN